MIVDETKNIIEAEVVEDPPKENFCSISVQSIADLTPAQLIETVGMLDTITDDKELRNVKRMMLSRADELEKQGMVGNHFHEDLESALNEEIKAMKAIGKKKKKISSEAEAQPLNFTDIPINETLMSHFTTSSDNIQGVSRTPMILSAVSDNITTGEHSATIAVKTRKGWREKTYPFATISSPQKLLNLADIGAQINHSNAKHVMEFFDDMLSCNAELYDGPLYHVVASAFGWTEYGFAGYAEKIEMAGIDDLKPLVESIKPVGDLRAWVNALKPDLQNVTDSETTTVVASKLRIAVDSALASILIEPLGLQCFMVHVHGKSGAGKTVTLRICASLFGDPRNGRYFRTLNGTINSLTSLCSTLNSLPLVADEIETIRTRKGYDKAIMSLTEGIDRGRLRQNGKYMEQRTWANTTITSGESDIVTKHSMLGIHNRVISIYTDTSNPMVQDFKTVATTISSNYGLIGPLAVKYVNDNKDELIEICDEYRTLISDKYKCTGKVAAMFAGILTADYVLCNVALNSETVFPKGDGLAPLEIEEIAPYITPTNTVEQWVHAKDVIVSYVWSQQDKFLNDETKGGKFKPGCVGSFSPSTGVVKIEKSALVNLLEAKGILFDWVKSDLAEHGILIKSKDGKHYQEYSSVGSCRAYFVTLKINDLKPQ